MQNHSESQREAPKDISGIKEALRAVNDICKRYAEHIIHGHKEDEMALHPKPSKEVTIDALHQFRLAVGENFSNLSSQDVSEIRDFLEVFYLYLMDSENDTNDTESKRIIKDILSLLENREEKPTERKKIKTLLSPTESWAQTFVEELKALEAEAQGDFKNLKIDPDSSAYKTLSGILKLGVFSEMKMDTFFNCQAAVQNFRAKMGNEISAGHFVPFEALLRNLELKMSFWLNGRVFKEGINGSTSRLQN